MDDKEKSKIQLLKERLDKDPKRKKLFTKSLSDDDVVSMNYDWSLWARPKQLEPKGDWTVWLILAGRGFGKTRTGSETIRKWVETKKCKRIALVADTAADARDVMIEGPSGLLATAHPTFKPIYNPSQRKLEWPNGAVAHTYSAEAFEALRGPEHDGAWVDELAKMAYQQEVWDNLMFGMRLGKHPKVVVTTTPRPTKLMKELIKDDMVVLTRGSMFENVSNLAEAAVIQLKKKYQGTRIGRQELYAELLEDNPNALFMVDWIDDNRVRRIPDDLMRICVAIDPSGTSHKDSDEVGLVVTARDYNDQGYVLADETMIGSPNEWAQKAVSLYKEFKADIIVAETNYGGDMVKTIINNADKNVNFQKVTATRGKAIRAEPISALYEQGRIHHVGAFNELEDQMLQFDPSLGRNQKSPDRMDALVWGLTELFGDETADPNIWFV